MVVEKRILKDVDLHIKSGETIGIIGGTGSAKSSLVNLISRLYDVDEGSVVVGGQDVRNYDSEVLRDEVSLSYKRMFYLVEQSYKIYVGVMKMQQKKNVKKLVV